MRKVIIITGLTASGKSGLAIKIAEKYNGEIISADSVQIYRGLDIGSAKESKEIMAKIPHHLIDIKDFDESYNVGEFMHDCEVKIKDIISRDKTPIIVGGTAMYIKALLEGYSLGTTSAHNDFREKYQKLAQDKGNEYVWDELNKLNPEKAKTVHYNNLKRVIRYLEIEHYGKEDTNLCKILDEYNVCAVGIIADREMIYNRINNRVDEMIKDGLKEEVEGLLKSGASFDNQSLTSIGYREWVDYYSNKLDLNQTIDLIKQHTRNYCKRQLTFLKTIKGLKLLELIDAEEYIKGFLNDTNR